MPTPLRTYLEQLWLKETGLTEIDPLATAIITEFIECCTMAETEKYDVKDVVINCGFMLLVDVAKFSKAVSNMTIAGVIDWNQESVNNPVRKTAKTAETYCPHCGAGPADASGELPHYRDCQEA